MLSPRRPKSRAFFITTTLADADDKADQLWLNTTPEERLDAVEAIRQATFALYAQGPTQLPSDWSEFLSLLISHGVKFLLVGGHAVAVHGYPRLTEDLDVFVEASLENAARIRKVLVDFGFGSAAPDEADLATPGRVFMLGVLPFRIDILTRISGVTFHEASKEPFFVESTVGRLPFLSRKLLLRNKQASGRTKDLADIEALISSRTTPP